jgi:hypothetical protein
LRDSRLGQPGDAVKSSGEEPIPANHPANGYSWAEICWSESRQALIFKRRQIQHKSSSSALGANVVVLHALPQTAQSR